MRNNHSIHILVYIVKYVQYIGTIMCSRFSSLHYFFLCSAYRNIVLFNHSSPYHTPAPVFDLSSLCLLPLSALSPSHHRFQHAIALPMPTILVHPNLLRLPIPCLLCTSHSHHSASTLAVTFIPAIPFNTSSEGPLSISTYPIISALVSRSPLLIITIQPAPYSTSYLSVQPPLLLFTPISTCAH